MFPTDVVIVAGARTPMVRYTGSFSDVSAIDLAAHASKEAIRRSGADPAEIDHAIFGNVMQTSADALYGARHVGLKAGLRMETPAVTVNRLCGSGIEAIAQGAQRLLLGEANMVLAGGMENMTQAPFVIRGAAASARLARWLDRKSTRLNSSHTVISYAVFCLKKKNAPSTFGGNGSQESGHRSTEPYPDDAYCMTGKTTPTSVARSQWKPIGAARLIVVSSTLQRHTGHESELYSRAQPPPRGQQSPPHRFRAPGACTCYKDPLYPPSRPRLPAARLCLHFLFFFFKLPPPPRFSPFPLRGPLRA